MAYSNPYLRSSLASSGLISRVGQDYIRRGINRRGLLLKRAIDQGKIQPSQLSSSDLRLAGQSMGQKDDGGFDLGSVLGAPLKFAGNLGSDIFQAAKGFAPGVYNLLRGAGETAGSKFLPGPLNEVGGKKPGIEGRVLNPMLESYAYNYLGKGADPDSNIGKRFFQHPLGFILDATAVGGLGANALVRAGSAAARRGVIDESSTLARLGSTERSSLPRARMSPDFDPGVQGVVDLPTVARQYSNRPLVKASQVAADKLGDAWDPFRNLQVMRATRNEARFDSALKHQQTFGAVGKNAAEPLVSKFNKLSPVEAEAAQLIGRGITSPEWIARYEARVQAALAGQAEEGARVADFVNVPKGIPENRANLPDEVKSLVLNPEQSPKLMEALNAYRETSARSFQDFDPEELATKANETRASLDPDGTITRGSHPFEDPMVMPSQTAANFEYSTKKGPITRALPQALHRALGQEPSWRRKQQYGSFSPTNVTYQNLLEEPNLSLRPNPNPILAGVTRPDARAFVDFIAKNERSQVEKIWNEEWLNKHALRDAEGNFITVRTPQEAERKFGPEWTATNPTHRIHWFQREQTAGEMIARMEEQGYPVQGPEMLAMIGAEAEDAVIGMIQGAKQMPAYVVPKEQLAYAHRLETASMPYSSPIMRNYAALHDIWRTWTLAFMPRWAVNTAVGSVVLNTIKGVNPLDYRLAMKVHRSNVVTPLDAKNLWGSMKQRRQEKKIESPFRQMDELSGVELGRVIGMEQMDMGAHAGISRTGPVAEKIREGVQGLEDFFRRASFMQSLDREAKQQFLQMGRIIDNVELPRKTAGRTVDDWIEYALDNPQAVRNAIQDVNMFSYNFAALGPFERRFVRQIIPFWGWYKFISGLAYKLPANYPGRTAMIAHLGQIGYNETEAQLGKDAPEWLSGVIPLGDAKNGKIPYLSTMGLNPFSQIFNPAGPEGLAGGSLQLSQGSPLLQTILQTYGVDTMRGGQVPVSPQAGVAQDFIGRLIDINKGEETDISKVEPGWRFLGSVLNSFPQSRILERARSGGRGSFPESVPFLHERYMPTKEENRYGASASDIFQQIVGFAPKEYNYKARRKYNPDAVKYARTRWKNQMKKLRKNLGS